MKTIALSVLAALGMASMQAHAADYGIGVSVQSDDSIIYAPIDFNDKFRLEPSLRYSKTEFDGLGGQSEFDNLELGVGLFGLSAVNQSLRLYYGGRASYIDQEQSNPLIAFIGGVTVVQGRTTSNSDGYRISPTIGFEFMFNERLSLGGEAEYFFQDIKGDDSTVDTETSGTDTRLILRFRF